MDNITNQLTDAELNNNLKFRNICKEIFRHSYENLKLKNNLDLGGSLIGIGIGTLITKAVNRYSEGSFTKSVQNLKHPKNIPLPTDMEMICSILDYSDFQTVRELLKIHQNLGLIEAISWTRNHI